MESLNEMLAFSPAAYSFNLIDVLAVLSLSCFLSTIIAKTYTETHSGISYSQGISQTLVIISVVVAAVMLIVGSNIARAFTLLGALSIVRFRNAVKDTRDVGFIFFSMAVGMACGTRFYIMSVTMTLFICVMTILMQKFKFGRKTYSENLLRVSLPKESDVEKEVNTVFTKNFKAFSLISAEPLSDDMIEYSYAVSINQKANIADILTKVKSISNIHGVIILSGESTIEI